MAEISFNKSRELDSERRTLADLGTIVQSQIDSGNYNGAALNERHLFLTAIAKLLEKPNFSANEYETLYSTGQELIS